MTIRLAALLAVVIVALLPTATVQAQATDPPYLSQMPVVDRVMAEIKGPDPMDSAARQMGAFWQLQKMVEDLAGDRRWRNQLTPDEGALIGQYRYGYALASKPYDHIGNAPSHPDKPAWFKLYNFYLYDDGLLDELLQRFFSPEFRTAYYQASGKQPPTHVVEAPVPPSAQPTAPAGESMEAYLEQGHEYYRDKDYTKAIDAYKRAIALETSLGAATLPRQDEDEAWLLAVERHVTQNASDPLALTLLGDTHWRFSDYPNALEAYRHLFDLKPSSQILAGTHFRIGSAYSLNSEYEEAVGAFREALRLRPEDNTAHALLGFAYYKLEQYPEALVELQKVIRVRPDIPAYHSWAGKVYLEGLRQYGKAVASFQEAIRLRPNDGYYRLDLGKTYLAMGKKGEALQVYRELQTIDAERAQELYAEINESS